jgi:hypothetical protein
MGCTPLGGHAETSDLQARPNLRTPHVPSFAPATRLNDSTYVDDLGGGRKLVTYVIWVNR